MCACMACAHSGVPGCSRRAVVYNEMKDARVAWETGERDRDES